jgi:hypothetical protein
MSYFKSAVAFFFLFFLHGFSIGNSQQGISYNVWCFAKAGHRRTNVELTTKDN